MHSFVLYGVRRFEASYREYFHEPTEHYDFIQNIFFSLNQVTIIEKNLSCWQKTMFLLLSIQLRSKEVRESIRNSINAWII